MIPVYRQFQEIYASLILDHEDAFAKMPWEESPEIVNNALNYFKENKFPLIYPAKSYAVAIIYATLIEQVYGYPLRDTLSDPELFLGQDDFYVTYDQDPVNYETIIEGLEEIPDWLNSGWAPQTVKYFYAECTAEGIDQTTNNFSEKVK